MGTLERLGRPGSIPGSSRTGHSSLSYLGQLDALVYTTHLLGCISLLGGFVGNALARSGFESQQPTIR